MKFCLLICCLLATGVIACGSSDDAGEATGSGSEASSQAPASAEAGNAALGQAETQQEELVTKVKGAPTPPKFELPPGPPPKEVVIRDLRKGRGAEIQSDDFFSASYISLNYRTGDKVVEDSWTGGPFDWYWGREQLSQGWEIGLEGMRVGGLRELLVPSELAYGDGARAYLLELLQIGDKIP